LAPASTVTLFSPKEYYEVEKGYLRFLKDEYRAGSEA
jgi:hypothetical protein